LIFNHLALLTMYPEYLRFLRALRNPEKAQENVLTEILTLNSGTDFGKEHGFTCITSPEKFREQVPISEYNDYARYIDQIKSGKENSLTHDRVLILEPTGGSTSGTKLIPYSKTLQKQFSRGIYPWLVDLFLEYPRLMKGKSYWSITPPNIKPYRTEAGIPVGFKDDTDYFGKAGDWIKRGLIEPPLQGLGEFNQEEFYYLTLFYLLREKNLTFISAWHPSFLIILMRYLDQFKSELIHDIASGQLRVRSNLKFKPNPKRAGDLEQGLGSETVDFKRVWPELSIISCWTQGPSAMFIPKLERLFPGITIQAKGLLATEGIVSFPFKGSGGNVISIRSHFLEFIERETGSAKFCWELERGRLYTVLITTAGGLYRYNMHDIVRVTGFDGRLPLIEFCGKEDLVVDYFGEKLNEYFIRINVEKVLNKFKIEPEFMLFVPAKEDGFHYRLEIFTNTTITAEPDEVSGYIDALLKENIQYKNARDLGQIRQLRTVVKEFTQDTIPGYVKKLSAQRGKTGIVKPLIISGRKRSD